MVNGGSEARNRLLRAYQSLRAIGENIPLTVGPRPTERRILRALLGRDARVVLDVGASLGAAAARYARLFPSATIHCFEPGDGAFRRLKRRFESTPRVVTHHLGVGSGCGQRRLNVNKVSSTSSFLAAAAGLNGQLRRYMTSDGIEEVSLTTLDRFCTRHGIERVDLLKCDTQGFENQVLVGARELLRNRRISVIRMEILFSLLYDGQATVDEIHSELDEDYRIWTLMDPVYDRSGRLLYCDVVYVSREHGGRGFRQR